MNDSCVKTSRGLVRHPEASRINRDYNAANIPALTADSLPELLRDENIRMLKEQNLFPDVNPNK